MMPQKTVNDASRLVMSEPTKYIIRCCELRKRREVKPAKNERAEELSNSTGGK